ncbi:MAG TPA: hypothetical protein VKV80_01825 [Streptosporangiaceae bacterium]|nr:hypothetical protein [Streptosporangiaceae bacterium]
MAGALPGAIRLRPGTRPFSEVFYPRLPRNLPSLLAAPGEPALTGPGTADTGRAAGALKDAALAVKDAALAVTAPWP